MKFTVPIGQSTFFSEVLTNLDLKDYYRATSTFPPPLILHLDSGEGRTTLLTYSAVSYDLSGVFRPKGIDRFLDLTAGKGLPADTRRVLAAIRGAAVYGTSYGGVIGIDIGGAAAHLNEPHTEEFIGSLKDIARESILVLFLPAAGTNSTARLEEKLCTEIEDIKSIPFEPYTTEQLRDIILVRLAETGAVIPIGIHDKAESLLLDATTESGVSCVKEAVRMSNELVRFADLSTGRPVFTLDSFKAYRGHKTELKGAEK